MTAPIHRLRQRTLESLWGRGGTKPHMAASMVSREDRYIRLPWSRENQCTEKPAQLRGNWDVIVAILSADTSKNMENFRDLLKRLYFYGSSRFISCLPCFGTLCLVIDSIMTPSERVAFFHVTLPWMKRRVIDGPVVLPRDLHALSQGESRRLILTHEEAATLLTCGFFSLFPGRCSNSRSKSKSSDTTASFNFADLFSLAPPGRIESQVAKIRCLLQYFIYCSHHADAVETCLEFYRVSFLSFPDLGKSLNPMQSVTMLEEGLIEDNYGSLQVDFANKYVGGGVLRTGCVQEEIRFMMCPELLLSCLFTEPLLDNEVLFMSGAGQYSVSVGYASGFRFICGHSPHFVKLGAATSTPREIWVELVPTSLRNEKDCTAVMLRNSCVVAMDAINYCGCEEKQYLASSIIRETRKAFAAFKGTPDSILTSVHSGPVATGNWGCGAFSGDRELKTMIQWCAASEAKRPLIYSSINDSDLCYRFGLVYKKLQEEEWTVGDVFTALLLFSQRYTTNPTSLEEGSLFQYILSFTNPRCASSHSGTEFE
ncbi:putative poly(ADP-ribose) glycohydrolase [Trypanosoma cruzi]|nr:putative poly(ADP-ribose) glycohydrolase [Trypanosoma cruzi]